MAQRLHLKVENFRAITRADLEIDKITVLYGPNGGGKSTIIHALLLATGIRDDVLERIITRGLRKGTRITLESDNGVIECIFDNQLRCNCMCRQLEVKGRFRSDRDLIECSSKVWGVERVSYVYRDRMVVYNISGGEVHKTRSGVELRINDLDLWDSWEILNEYDVVFAEDGRRILSDVEELIEATNVYGRYVERNGAWYEILSEAYGYKRAVMITLAAAHSDVLLVENLDNGLHVDLLINLVSRIAEFSKLAVLETHVGLLLHYALTEKWKAYHIDKTAKQLTLEDLKHVDLFKRELEAYGYAR